MNLLPNEIEITTHKKSNITVTNLRVRESSIEFGKEDYCSIFLENIGSVRVKFKSYPILILLALLLPIVATTLGLEEKFQQSSFFFGAALFFLFFYTKNRIIKIVSSGGEAIEIAVENVSSGQILDFIDVIEEAKLTRMKQLYKDKSVPMF